MKIIFVGYFYYELLTEILEKYRKVRKKKKKLFSSAHTFFPKGKF